MFTNTTVSSRLNPSIETPKQHTKKVDFAILSAMPEELDFFKNTFSQTTFESINVNGFELRIYEYRNKKILVTFTGLGTTFASSIMTLIHHYFSPDYILISGTAGSIKPELKLRDVVIVENAFEAETQEIFKLIKNTPFETCLIHPLKKQPLSQTYSADEDLLQIANSIDIPDVRIHKGTVVSSNAFPAPKELFEKIKAENPYCIDMETSAFYQIAWLLKARVIAVRGISNILNHDGSDDQIHESDVKGSAEAAAKVLLKILDSLLLDNKYLTSQKPKIRPEAENQVAKLIKKFNLQPHPEGGYYARSFQSKNLVKSVDKNIYDDEHRNAGTSIYYLLKNTDFSAWHSLKSDELWHFYTGSSIKIYVIDKKGNLSSHVLGNPFDNPDASYQVAITMGDWFAAELIDKTSYCLVGCTVNPGFEFKDFKLADRNALTEQFPQHASLIMKLTRDSSHEQNFKNSHDIYNAKLI